MNICILSTSLTVHRMGGTEVHAEGLAAEAARQGHRVFLMTASHPAGKTRETREGYEVIYLEGTSHRMSRSEAPAWWRASASAVPLLCEREKIDVVWAENFAGLAYAAIPRAARRPVISVVQGLGIRGEITSRFAEVSSPGGLAYFLTRYAAQTLFYYIPRFRAMVRDSDALIAVSRETAAALGSEFPASASKTEMVFNPVDIRLFRPDPVLRRAARQELGLGPGTRVALMSGVMSRQKGTRLGLESFAAAAAKCPEAILLIVGDGAERPALEKAAAAGLAGRTIFTGARPNHSMPFYYNAADVYLNPTLRLEGFGIVTAEAMACGLPCVVSRSGGTGSTIEEGRSGFFTKPGDARGMALHLGRLLADPELSARMGTEGRRRAEEHFDREKAVARYFDISARLSAGK